MVGFRLAMVVAALLTLPAAVAAVEEDARRSVLSGRWNVVFDMPQGFYETPVEFAVGQNGEVTATVLGPLGTFRIADTAGRLEGNKLTLDATTSYGKLKVSATLEGDRLRGRWFPAGFFARLFFKGEMRGRRDSRHVAKPRLEVFDAVWAHIERDFYTPDFNGVNGQLMRQRYRPQVAAARNDGEFLAIMRRMLGEFRTSHLDFFATPAWSKELHPPAPPAAAANMATEGITWRQLAPSVGYLRIESFEDGPKVVARVDRAFAEIGYHASLVIDLRGNGGGTLSAAMRLGDYILPKLQPVGYFASRDGLARHGARSIDQLNASALPVFSGYNSEDFGREMASAGALMLTTGGRGERLYRGRVVVLIDEYCFSASEALASVIKETRTATLIGRRTTGAMLSAIDRSIEGGWTLLLPVWDFRTPRGVRVEGRGVLPDIAVKSRTGKDADLAAAVKFLKTSAVKSKLRK
ncbi:MAG TPA: S41 family peptidase [Pyrinomonadaceae bacterium]